MLVFQRCLLLGVCCWHTIWTVILLCLLLQYNDGKRIMIRVSCCCVCIAALSQPPLVRPMYAPELCRLLVLNTVLPCICVISVAPIRQEHSGPACQIQTACPGLMPSPSSRCSQACSCQTVLGWQSRGHAIYCTTVSHMMATGSETHIFRQVTLITGVSQLQNRIETRPARQRCQQQVQ